MSTGVATTDETVVCDLGASEFDVPCSITTGRRSARDQAAVWWAQFECHCWAGEATFDLLLCPRHHGYITQGGVAICSGCGVRVVFKDYLLRSERIKP